MRLKAVAAFAIGLAGVGLPGGPLRAETLAEAVQHSIAWHPEMHAALSNYRAVHETVAQARAGYFPTVDATLARGRERTNSPVTRPLGSPPTLSRSESGLTLQQMLFDTGATSSEVKRQEARAEAAKAQLAMTGEAVALRTAQAFYEVLRLRALIRLAEQNLAIHQRTLDQVTRRSDAGVGRRSDDRQTSARVALAQSTHAQLRGQLEQAEALYRSQTGRAPENLVRGDVSSAEMPSSAQAAVDYVRDSHPAVRAARLDTDAALADRDFARSRYGPRVTFELGATHNRDIDGVRGLSADRTAMFVLRQNLFRGGGDDARVREAEARRDQAGDLLARVQNELERDVRQAWGTLAADRARLPDLQRYADASAEVVDAYRSQFGIGQRTLLDVLNAENELYNARSGYVTGDLAVLVDVYRLLGTMGRMLDSLGVPLPQ